VDAAPTEIPPATFDVASRAVVKSVRHRWLLKEWDLSRGAKALPLRTALARDDFDAYRPEFSTFAVHHEGMRFLLESHGSYIGRAYGSNCAGKYLDQIVPSALQAQQIEPYRQAVRHRRPVYVTSDTRDLQSRPVQFERLLMPFSDDGRTVACVVADFEMISIEGGFSPADMLTAKNAAPSRRLAAVIGPD
jgi:hypothetical protein